ncbi:hypothetical protein KCU85_g8035, partial [Aureobasidium melanogenum]
MSNNFMLKLLILFFGCLNFFGAVAQISKKPDPASSTPQNVGYQASTLLTSVINKADIVPHDNDASNAQGQLVANATDPADLDNDEVLTDVEEDDDDNDDYSPANGDTAMSSGSKGGKRLKAHLGRYHKADCEKKRHPKKGKKMKEGKCHTLHKNHFKSYDFCIGEQKKDKKGKDDDDDDSEEDIPKGCRMMIFFDGKCKNEASSTNAEESCKDIGEEGVDDDDDDDDKDDKKLHARDLLTRRGKGPKYKSAKFLCDGVGTSDNTTKTMTEDDYYVTTTVSSQPVRVVTGSSSRSYTPSSITATRSTKLATRSSCSGEPAATSTPVDEKDPDDEDDDDDKDDDDKEDEKEDDDDDKETSATVSQTSSTKKHKSKSHKSKTHTKSKKHHSKTQTVSATQSAQATSGSPSP